MAVDETAVRVQGTRYVGRNKLGDFRTNERTNRKENCPYMTYNLDGNKILKLLDSRTDISSATPSAWMVLPAIPSCSLEH